MKLKFLALTVHRNMFVLPALAAAGSLIFTPLTFAAVYNDTVDLNTTTLSNNDSVIVDSKIGISSTSAGGAALQLDTGSISLKLTNTTPDQSIFGVSLANQANNHFGIGTSISVDQTAMASTNSIYDAYGIMLGNSTNMSASGLKVDVISVSAAQGIRGLDNNDIALGSDTTITVNGKKPAQGVMLGKTGHFSADGLVINVSSDVYSTGIQSAGADIDLGSGSKIIISSATNNNLSQGIKLEGAAKLTADRLTIDATNAIGLSAAGDATVNLGSNSTINASGDSNAGILVRGNNVNLEANRLTLNTTGNNAYGVNLNVGAGEVKLGSNSKITTSGSGSTGIWMVSGSSNILTADALTIHTTGKNAKAIEVRRGHATIGNGSLLQTDDINTGTLAVSAILGQNASATINDSKLISKGTYAVLSQGALSSVNLNNVEVDIDRSGNPAYGLWASGGGGKINVNGMNLQAGAGVYGIVANNQGNVSLTGDIILTAQFGVAMLADGSGASISGSGNMIVDGMIAAQKEAIIDLTMTSGSRLNGAAVQSEDGKVNLSMDKAHWAFDQDSSVNTLRLTNGSTVDFQTSPVGLLTINDLSGGGLFKMRTDLMNANGDLINITGTTAGNHRVTVANSGSDTTDGSETLTIITTADGQGSFGLTNKVELGGYLYDLRDIGTDWELYSTGQITSSANASARFLNVSYLLNYAETQTLLQRMGDLRQGSDSGDVWVRAFHGKFGTSAGGKLSGFKMNYDGFQLGVDKASALSGGKMYTGAFMGLTDSNQNYTSGDGNLKSRSIGLYASYMLDAGPYIDAVVKYQHHSNKLDVFDTQGLAINGKGTSNGLSASLEGGHRFHLSEEKSGIYIEPQIQLTYSWQDSATVKNSNGLRVDLGSYDSVLGRIGTLLGYEVNKAGKDPVNFYFKSSWLHEFTGKTDYRLNGAREDLSFKGSAWVSGVGVSTQLNNSHTVYLDMEKTVGKAFNQDQINVGYRYRF